MSKKPHKKLAALCTYYVSSPDPWTLRPPRLLSTLPKTTFHHGHQFFQALESSDLSTAPTSTAKPHILLSSAVHPKCKILIISLIFALLSMLHCVSSQCWSSGSSSMPSWYSWCPRQTSLYHQRPCKIPWHHIPSLNSGPPGSLLPSCLLSGSCSASHLRKDWRVLVGLLLVHHHYLPTCKCISWHNWLPLPHHSL